MLVSKHASRQIAHDLMHLDQYPPGILRAKGNRFHVWTDLAPLLRPVGADFFVSTDKAAFERSRPSHVRSHEGEGSVDVSRVEGRIGCA